MRIVPGEVGAFQPTIPRTCRSPRQPVGGQTIFHNELYGTSEGRSIERAVTRLGGPTAEALQLGRDCSHCMVFQEFGAGSPVVLLHGAPSSPAYFDSLARSLAGRGHRVLIPQLPGYGASPLPANSSMAAVEEELIGDLRGRGVTKAAVVGFSLGGYRALRLALSPRFEVTHLVTLGGLSGFDPDHGEVLAKIAADMKLLKDFQDPAYRRSIALGMLAPAVAATNPEALRAVEGWLDATSPRALSIELTEAAFAENLLPRLEKLAIPVTARVGELDQATPLRYSEALVRTIPNARLEVVPRCGHALLLEDEPATIAAVHAALGA